MSEFIEKLGLSSVISKVDIRTSSDNLEDIYMELDERSKADPLCQDPVSYTHLDIFAEVVFSKVDTDNNFCRNPFSKVDTMIRSLVMSLFARDSSFG